MVCSIEDMTATAAAPPVAKRPRRARRRKRRPDTPTRRLPRRQCSVVTTTNTHRTISPSNRTIAPSNNRHAVVKSEGHSTWDISIECRARHSLDSAAVSTEVTTSNNVVVNLTIGTDHVLGSDGGGGGAVVTPTRRDRVASITIERSHAMDLLQPAVEISIRPADLLNCSSSR